MRAESRLQREEGERWDVMRDISPDDVSVVPATNTRGSGLHTHKLSLSCSLCNETTRAIHTHTHRANIPPSCLLATTHYHTQPFQTRDGVRSQGGDSDRPSVPPRAFKYGFFTFKCGHTGSVVGASGSAAGETHPDSVGWRRRGREGIKIVEILTFTRANRAQVKTLEGDRLLS